MNCYSMDSNTAVLEVFADDGTSYLLPYSQFLRGERTPNPAVEHEPAAPPEKLLLHFAQAEVVILGSGLKFVAGGIQKYDLKYVRAVDRLLIFDATLGAHIAAVTVTLNKQN